MAAIQPGRGAGSGCSDLPVHPLGPEACISMTTVGPDRQQTQVSVATAISSCSAGLRLSLDVTSSAAQID